MMGTMIGTGEKRIFNKLPFYHYGNSDTSEEAEDFGVDLRRLGYAVKITGDRHTGADIWIRQGKKGRFTVTQALKTRDITSLFYKAGIDY